MIKPGMFIADRYEIIDTVGSGGMADVYKARCHKLNRFVAVKILKEEFSTDESFVEKFRAEAQSAAGLQHPNIVNIYDVGEENGVYYIVMELIEGITLKNFIERKGRLDVREATGIAIQIAQGLEAAHANNIIHRDIKPQNIIISRDGKVKVADFGIAKAASSNTLTSSAMGSVHYISPEQARGGYSDEKSDIYSLGITMYEMINGKVPFEGDNAVSIALLHIQEEIAPLADLLPDIPVSTNKIVLKCLQKKPERRYLTVVEMISDLKRSLVEPGVDFVVIPDTLNNSPTIALSQNDVNAIRKGAMNQEMNMNQAPMNGPMGNGPMNNGPMNGPMNNGPMNNGPMNGPMGNGPMNGPMGNGPMNGPMGNVMNNDMQQGNYNNGQYNDNFIDPDEEKVDDKLEKITKIGGIIVLILVVVILFKFFVTDNKKKDDDTQPTQKEQISNSPTPTLVPGTSVEVVEVTGKREEEAKQKLTEQGFVVSVRYIAPPSAEYNGIVKEQQPEAGTPYPVGTAVTIVVYKEGAAEESELEVEEKTMPNLVNMSTVEASAKLNALFKVPSLTVEYKTINDDSVAIRNIVKTTPMAGEKIKNTGKVVIYISAGPDKNVIVPSLFGLSLEDATSKLESRGLAVGKITYETNPNFTPGTVLKQSHIANNTIEKGAKIDLVVNKAEEKTPTPAPTTAAPEVEYNVIVVYTGSVSDLFKEDAKDDEKITITGRIKYNGRDYTATDTISKASYELNGETEITFSIRSSTPVKDEDIQAFESSSITGASKDGAVARVKGFSVLKVN